MRSLYCKANQKCLPGKLLGHSIQGTVPSLGRSLSWYIIFKPWGWREDSRKLEEGDDISACLLETHPMQE